MPDVTYYDYNIHIIPGNVNVYSKIFQTNQFCDHYLGWNLSNIVSNFINLLDTTCE